MSFFDWAQDFLWIAIMSLWLTLIILFWRYIMLLLLSWILAFWMISAPISFSRFLTLIIISILKYRIILKWFLIRALTLWTSKFVLGFLQFLLKCFFRIQSTMNLINLFLALSYLIISVLELSQRLLIKLFVFHLFDLKFSDIHRMISSFFYWASKSSASIKALWFFFIFFAWMFKALTLSLRLCLRLDQNSTLDSMPGLLSFDFVLLFLHF